MKTEKKVIVIGLDSATFSVIDPLLKKGMLPTFKKLMTKGSWGVLESSIPPITPIAWETAVTGVNPGRHNIFDFFFYRSDYDVDVVSAKDRAAQAVWDYAGFSGKRSIVFNYPMGFPPPKINGIFVSGMNTPGVNTDFTYPESIKNEILKKFPNFKIDVLGDHIVNGREDLYYEDILKLTEVHYKTFCYLLKKYQWDLSLFFLTELDRVQHYFLHDVLPDHPLNKNRKVTKNRIADYFNFLDGLIADLIKQFPKATLLIFSDHGTEPLEKDVFIEKYLIDWGYLFLKKAPNKKGYTALSKSILFLRKLVYKVGIAERILKYIPGGLFTFLVRMSSLEGKESAGIDWQKTKVYFPTPSSQGLRINLKGREASGSVPEKKYEATRDAVIKKLLSLKDPNTGIKVIKHVYKREDIYKGPYVQNAQDLIVETDHRYHLQKGTQKGYVGLASEAGVPKSAEHGREAMWMAYGINIREGKRERLRLVDIAAMILYILGIVLPQKLEGKVIKEIFK